MLRLLVLQVAPALVLSASALGAIDYEMDEMGVSVGGVHELLSPPEQQKFKTAVYDRWGPIAVREEERTGVPWQWTLAFIYRESGGNPTVVSADGGYGLMQITSKALFQGHDPKETLSDPALNIRLGVDFMSRLISQVGFDFPKVSSCFNAGCGAKGPHPSEVSPWGYRETKGHISSEVRALNYAHTLPRPIPLEEPDHTVALVLVGALALGAGALYARRHLEDRKNAA